MSVVTNSFEGLTLGATISAANSGGASGTAFDAVNIGSGGALTAASGAAHGALCASLEDTSAATTDLVWTSAGPFGAQTSIYYRMYIQISANPGNSSLRLFNVTTGGGSITTFFLNTSGKVEVTYSSSGTLFVISTAAVPIGSWFRIEGFVIVSTSVGQVGFSLFTSGMDNVPPDETHTSAATLNIGTLSGTTSYNFGDSSSIVMTSAILFDDIGLSSTGPLGPVGASAIPVPIVSPSMAVQRARAACSTAGDILIMSPNSARIVTGAGAQPNVSPLAAAIRAASY